VGPLKPNTDYRFVVECTNAAGVSSSTEPVLHTVRDNEMLSVVPLYGIILYAGPLTAIPGNFRRLDGSEPGVPNLTKVFKITPGMMDDAMVAVATPGVAPTPAAAAGSTPSPAWSSLCYIQRIA
jgi:hypothetical protein